MDILLQVIQVLTFYIPYLEVTNNLWRGRVYTIPKMAQSQSCQNFRRRWCARLMAAAPLLIGATGGMPVPPSLVIFSAEGCDGWDHSQSWKKIRWRLAVKFLAVHLHQQVSAMNLKKKLWNAYHSKNEIWKFIHSTVVGTSFIVGCLSYRLVGG